MTVDKKISTFSIPLDEPKEQDTLPIGKMIVVRSSEICLTCGGVKRLRWIERVDGNKIIKEACLFCITTPDAPKPTSGKLDEYTKRMRENYINARHTTSNRRDH